MFTRRLSSGIAFGFAIQRRPAGVSDMVDAAERYLDEHGLARPHLAGNSLGRMGGHRVGTAWARRERLRFLPGGLLVGQRFS